MNLDGSEIDSLFYGGSLSIALDVGRGRLFFADNSFSRDYLIRVARLDASWAKIWALEPATAIVFDAISETMYFYADDAIQSVEDRPGSEITLTTGVSNLQSLSLDLAGEAMYWSELISLDGNRWRSKIRRANLDGSGDEDVIRRG